MPEPKRAPQQETKPEELIVEVTIDENGAASPDPFHISKSRHQQVRWKTSDGQPFAVEFEESPFYESTFGHHSPYSGSIHRKVAAHESKTYKYTVRRDGKDYDPTGIIDR
jgi:hypothetical protein